jgi:pimeloyl-ACP methyl ester carboxylesterase
MTLAAILLLLLFLSLLLYPFYVVHKHTLGHHEPITHTPGEWGVEYEDIAYETDDGIVLRGWWIKAKSQKAILLMHGKSGSRNGYHSGIFDLARHYHEKGWNVMMADLRAHGESGGERVTFGLKEHTDMLGWIDSLGKGSEYRWRLHGFSMGAVTALMMAEKRPGSFERVIADAPWIDFERLVKQELWRRASLPPFLYGYVKWVAKRFFGQDFDFVDNRRRCKALCGREILYIFEEEDTLLGSWHKALLKRLCPTARIAWFEGVGHVEAFKMDPLYYLKWLNLSGETKA